MREAWKRSQTPKDKNTDIMELIQHKSYGPVAAMKRNFRKDMLMMALLPAILILTNASDLHAVFTSIMFWSYVAFCIVIVASTYTSYRIADNMSMMDGMVRSSLEQQVLLLERRFKWHIIGLRIVMLYFIILTEILPYFQHYRMLDAWHSLPVVVRYGAYAALLVTQYFASRRVCEHKYGQHIAYLKDMLADMK